MNLKNTISLFLLFVMLASLFVFDMTNVFAQNNTLLFDKLELSSTNTQDPQNPIEISEITCIPQGNAIKTSFSIINNTGENYGEKYLIVLAAYKADTNKLVKVQLMNQNPSLQSGVPVNIQQTLSGMNSGRYYVKVMLWNSITDMKSLVASKGNMVVVLPAATPVPTDYTVNYSILNAYSGVHPRMFVDTNTVSSLKTAIRPGGTHASLWNEVKSQADTIVATTPPPYDDSTDEQLYQREVGESEATLGMAYLLTQNTGISDTRWLEAENGIVTSPMQIYSDTTAAGGKYVKVPSGTAAPVPDPNALPDVKLLLTLGTTTNYNIWVRVLTPDSNSDSIYMAIDSGNYNLLDLSGTTGWKWIKVSDSTSLAEGEHIIKFKYAEANCGLDKIVVTNNMGYTPSGMGTEQHWIEAESGTLASPIQSYNDEITSSRQNYISAKSATVNPAPTPAAGAPAEAQYSFNVTGGQNYDIWICIKASDSNSNSCYYAVDNGSYASFTAATGTEWTWQKISTVNLAAGSHTLNIKYRNPKLKIDTLMVSGDTSGTAPAIPNKYLMAGIQYVMASCSYPTWAMGSSLNCSLATAHQLFGVGVFYDWCYNSLTDTNRNIIRSKLIYMGDYMNASANTTAWWKRSYLQNHLWVNMCGLATAGAAIFDEYNGAKTWLDTSMDKYKNISNALGGNDGVSQEGIGYWQYAMEYIGKYATISKKLFGVDIWRNTWLQNTSDFQLYAFLPRNSWTNLNNHMDIADEPRYNWYGPDYVLRGLANHYRNTTAQWAAQQVDDANVDDPCSRWLNLIWYDPDVAAVSPQNAGIPTMKWFTDKDEVFSRSAWDGNESVVFYKCGPALGHYVRTNYTWDIGANHVHPDVNNFTLFGSGEWLIKDDGYAYKSASQHNTLLVNGQGQYGGEGVFTFNGFQYVNGGASPYVKKAISTDQIDYIVGEGSPAYDPNTSKLTKYTRHLIFVKPMNVLIVADNIALSASRSLELRFFPEQQTYTQSNGSYITTGIKSKLQVTPLTLSGVTVSPEKVSIADEWGGTLQRLAYRLTKTGSSWQNATAFSWSSNLDTPKNVTYYDDGNGVWRFVVGNKTVALNITTETAGIYDTPPANAAQGRPITVDSYMDTYTGANAVDGVVSDTSRWMSDNTNGPHWAEIDLGSDYTLSGSEIYTGCNGSDSVADFVLQMWNGSGWTDIPGSSVTGNSKTTVIQTFTSPVTTHKVRFYSTDNGYVRVKEIKLIGVIPDVPTNNIALGKTVTVDSATAPYTGDKTVDGEISDASRWMSDNSSNAHWVQIDLGKNYTLNGSEIYMGYSGSYPVANFALQMWDGTSWANIPGASVTNNTSTYVKQNFTSSVITNKVRFYTDDNSYIRVKEIMLCGW